MRLKKGYTAVAIIGLVVLYVMIFILSADDAEQSSEISRAVTNFFYKIYNHLFQGNMDVIYNDAIQDTLEWEGLIRKLAHFTEYLGVGFLSYSVMALWFPNVWKNFGFVMIQLLLSASADEFHQYFVPGRHASVKDVCIDCTGGIAGILLFQLLYFLGKKIKGYR